MADASAPEGEAVLARAVSAYQAALGSRLIAGYALGSLAHGGFSPLVSDVDLGLILQDPLRARDRMTIHKVARSLRSGGSALHERLSVFWGTPSTLQGQGRGGRFPPLDRLDLLDYGRLLTGRDARSGVARPEQAELLVAGAEFALGYLGGARDSCAGLGPAPPPERQRTGRNPHPLAAGLPRAPAADQGRALPRPLPFHRGDGPGGHQHPCGRALRGQHVRARRQAGYRGPGLAPRTAGRR